MRFPGMSHNDPRRSPFGTQPWHGHEVDRRLIDQATRAQDLRRPAPIQEALECRGPVSEAVTGMELAARSRAAAAYLEATAGRNDEEEGTARLIAIRAIRQVGAFGARLDPDGRNPHIFPTAFVAAVALNMSDRVLASDLGLQPGSLGIDPLYDLTYEGARSAFDLCVEAYNRSPFYDEGLPQFD